MTVCNNREATRRWPLCFWQGSILKVGAPTIVIHPVFFQDGQHLGDIGDDRFDVQLALDGGIEAENGSAVIQLHLFGIGHFETGLEQVNRCFFQTVEILAGEVVLDVVIRIGIAAIGQQFVDDLGGLIAPLLPYSDSCCLQAVSLRQSILAERIRLNVANL